MNRHVSVTRAIFFSVLLLGWSRCVFASDYTTYHDLVNRAEQRFIAQRDSSCYSAYDSAFAAYRPFIKDPYIAAQIAFSLRDERRMLHYLGIAAQAGMPLTAVNAAPLLRNGLNAQQRAVITRLFECAVVTPPERPDLLDRVCAFCHESDSIKLVMGTDPESNQAFWRSEAATLRFVLDSFLVHGRFINERVLGISTTAGRQDFLRRTGRRDPYAGYGPQSPEENELRLKCPMNIVLHSRCFFTTHRPLFVQAMRNGYLHPKEFATLAETAVLWHQGEDHSPDECIVVPSPDGYYNVFRGPRKHTFTDTPEGLAHVERNRAAIHLQSYAVDQQKLALERAEGFAFFFDFVDRP